VSHLSDLLARPRPTYENPPGSWRKARDLQLHLWNLPTCWEYCFLSIRSGALLPGALPINNTAISSTEKAGPCRHAVREFSPICLACLPAQSQPADARMLAHP
jgi:hypothetical protein